MREQRLVLVGRGVAHEALLARWPKFREIEVVELTEEQCVDFSPVDQEIILSDGRRLHYDYISFDVSAKALKLFALADLAGSSGFLEVSASLNTPIFSNVFGTARCSEFRPDRSLARDDAMSLRQVPLLLDNLLRSVQGRYDYQKFSCQPQRRSVIFRPMEKSPLLYIFMVVLAAGVTFIGWNFGHVTGAVVGFLFSCLGNAYALQIKPHE